MSGKTKNKIIFILIFLFLVWLVIVLLFFRKEENNIFKVVFLDVGQGDSVLISDNKGNQILYDGGADYSVLKQLSSTMPRFDRKIELVIASHADLDHIGGLPAVFDFYQVKNFFYTGDDSESLADDILLDKVNKENITPVIIRSGLQFKSDTGIELYFLHPEIIQKNNENNSVSVVAKVNIGEINFLLTGDIPQNIEQKLVQEYGDFLQVEVLKLAHHGSNTSSGQSFLETVNPLYSIVSAGLDNRYGHPSQEVIERVGKQGSIILETAKKGNIIFETDGKFLRSR